jgi:hypothetical protein
VDAPQLRPLGIGEILDVSLKIAWRNAGTFLRIVLFVVLPAQVLTSLVQVSSVSDYEPGGVFGGGGDTTVSSDDEWAALAALLVSLVISFLASQLATGACFKAVAEGYLGGTATWRESLRFAFRRLHSILWIVILGGFLTLLGLVVVIVGAIYLWVAFAVALPVLMTEGLRGRRALSRSRQLVKGRWWKTFLLLVVAGLLASVIGGAVSAAVAALSFVSRDDEALLFVVGAISGTAGSLVTTPFKAAYTTVLYFDLRVRKEAFDLQLLAEQLGVEPPEGWTPPAPAPVRPAGDGDQPPFWPPPPGWQPREPS